MSAASQRDLFGAPSEAPARPRTSMDAGHYETTSPRGGSGTNPTRGMARTGDPDTSKAAAAAIAPHADRIYDQVLLAFAAKPMTAKECVALPCWARWKPKPPDGNSVRKRVSEAAQQGDIVPTGRVIDRSQEYRYATPHERARILAGKPL